jgi:type I restriction enzyme, S subunit
LVRPDQSSVVPEYLWGYIVSYRIQRKITEMDKGAAMPHLQITELAKFPIKLPPLNLQSRFATIVESVEQQKARLLRQHLAELDALFASLQQRAFNGDL